MANDTRKWMEGLGVADTRTFDISTAMAMVHSAAAKLDQHNQHLLWKLVPEFMQLANIYAKLESGLATFPPREQINETVTVKTDAKALTG